MHTRYYIIWHYSTHQILIDSLDSNRLMTTSIKKNSASKASRAGSRSLLDSFFSRSSAPFAGQFFFPLVGRLRLEPQACPRCFREVIYQTREIVFNRDIQSPRRELTTDAQRSIFDEIRSVWKAEETLSRLFDISSQTKQKLSSTRRSKVVKISAN